MLDPKDYAGKLLNASKLVSNTERTKIIFFLENRKVNHLLHFTEISNLKSILGIGLTNREFLTENKIDFKKSDEMRLDFLESAISLSIAFPNKKMLYSKKTYGDSSEYIVIEVSLNILYEKDSNYVFMPGNAARTDLKNDAMEFPEKYVGIAGLSRMFPPKSYRNKRNTMASIPLDIQAEIMFFNDIKPEKIQRIHFEKSLIETHPNVYEFLRKNHPQIVVCNNCKDRAFLKIVDSSSYQENFVLEKDAYNGE
jgi:hypothetical protein